MVVKSSNALVLCTIRWVGYPGIFYPWLGFKYKSLILVAMIAVVICR